MTLPLTTPPQQLQTPDKLVELMSRMALHDRSAFASLYQATSLKLYGVVFRILKRKHLAEDVLQDAYIKIWERAGDFDATRGSAIAWIVAIARNKALDEVRRRPQLVSSEDVTGFDNIASSDIGAEADLVCSAEYQKLSRCLGDLDADKRAMLLMAYQGGASREVLAQRYNAPVATIKTWLRRSLQSLKDCLDHD